MALDATNWTWPISKIKAICSKLRKGSYFLYSLLGMKCYFLKLYSICIWPKIFGFSIPLSSLFRNNRFDTPDRAAKNRIIAPTSILHFYNVPKMEDEEMEAIFTDRGAPAPNKVKWFPAKSDKSVSGLVEFDSVQEACESLVMINHTEIEGTNKKYPYCMKLCFSPATH